MALQYLAVDTSIEIVEIGSYYAYLYHNKLCVGVAIPHPTNKSGDRYIWAMRNCYTGKVEYPYQKDIIVPNSEYREVYCTLNTK